MALTTCPDCEKEISDAAPACPHCVRPMRSEPITAHENLVSGHPARKRRRPGLVTIVAIGIPGWVVGAAYLNTLPSSNATEMAMRGLHELAHIIQAANPESRTAESSTGEDALPPVPREAYESSLSLGGNGEPNKLSFDTEPSPTGAPACNVYIRPGRNSNSQRVAIKIYSGQKSLDFVLFKASWKFSANAFVPVSIESKGVRLMVAQGRGFAQFVDFHVPAEAVPSLRAELIQSHTITLSFPGSPEPDWRVSMDGVPAYMAKQRICSMRDVMYSLPTQAM